MRSSFSISKGSYDIASYGSLDIARDTLLADYQLHRKICLSIPFWCVDSFLSMFSKQLLRAIFNVAILGIVRHRIISKYLVADLDRAFSTSVLQRKTACMYVLLLLRERLYSGVTIDKADVELKHSRAKVFDVSKHCESPPHLKV